MNIVETLDKKITISHAQRADAPQGKIFKLQEYQKKRINKSGQVPLSTMEMRLSILWKPLLTQYTLSEAHRNAQCVGSRPDLFIRFFVPLPTTKIYSSISKLRNSVKNRPCSSLDILTSISRLSILIRPAENKSSV